MQVVQEVTGLGEANALQLASGFGGGIGRAQSLCGAITGAVMLIGMREARQPRPFRELNGATRPLARQFLQGFVDRFGTAECRQLTGADFGDPAGFQAFQDSGRRRDTCALYISYAIEEMIKG